MIVRNLDDELVARLKLRAAEHGRSAEAEHRQILRGVLATEPRRSFKERVAKVRATTAPPSYLFQDALARRAR